MKSNKQLEFLYQKCDFFETMAQGNRKFFYWPSVAAESKTPRLLQSKLVISL
jgi:hypothetical protein